MHGNLMGHSVFCMPPHSTQNHLPYVHWQICVLKVNVSRVLGANISPYVDVCPVQNKYTQIGHHTMLLDIDCDRSMVFVLFFRL